ncbi:hypothetical protein [Nocardioides yefusunii]|uniref:Uncharacterized protein n=1 Tax=Nocardioides yefusunii TaxID=2500546 RepID=A0ABW1QZI9_9ACTN|nr:hypothetical protein [Nocardioides yefusunii]
MRTSRAVRLAAVAALLALAAGCSGNAADDGTPLDVNDAPAVTSKEQIVLPFDAYSLSTEQDRLNLQAISMLLSQCGEKYGVPVQVPVGQNPALEELNARRYGIIDGRRAQTHGYRPELSSAETAPRNGWDPTPLQQAVLTGDVTGVTGADLSAVPVGGCYAEVNAQLGGDEPSLVQDLGAGIYAEAEQDERVQTTWQEWSDCMEEKGYEYSSPWEPNNADWPTEVSGDEVRTAVDDVECRERTNLVGVWMAVETALQREAVERNPEGFSAAKEWHETRVRSVSEALGATGGAGRG